MVIKEKSLDENEIKAKYSDKIAAKLIGLNDKIEKISGVSNSHFAIRIEHVHYITKDKDKATSAVDFQSRNPTNVARQGFPVNGFIT